MKSWDQMRTSVLEDYWAGKISQVRADEMLRNIDYQERTAKS